MRKIIKKNLSVKKILYQLTWRELGFFGLIFSISFFSLSLILTWQIAYQASYLSLTYQPLPKADLIWERKINATTPLKIGIITDTHLRASRIDRMSKAPNTPRQLDMDDKELLNRFSATARAFQADATVHIGDVIEGTDDPDYVGMESLKVIKNQLNKSNIPVFWVVGNHDLRSVSKEQFGEIFNLAKLNYSKDIGDYRLIFLDGNFNPNNVDSNFIGEGYLPGFVHPETIAWLKQELKTDKRVYVFMHQAVVGLDFFENGESYKSAVLNWRAVMNLFERYNVEAFFNGHIETRYYKEINGVKYYSLTGTKKSLEYPESYYELFINNDESQLTMSYFDSVNKKIKKINFETGSEI